MLDNKDLNEQYYDTLKSYLLRQRESDLEAAYSIGRAAEVLGWGILDITQCHQMALARILKENATPLIVDILERASIVVNECLAPYEMAYRGFREANEKLQQLNDLLGRHGEELETSNEELRAVENALESERERLAVTIQSIGDGVISTDATGRIVLINEVAKELTGWKDNDAIRRPIQDVFNIVNEETYKRCENPAVRAIQGGQMVGPAGHTVLISKDGTERRIGDSGSPILNHKGETIGAVLVFRDLTNEIKLEEEMAKVGRLESIGVLAGGIAHDFNNILTVIEGNISFAKSKETGDQGISQYLEEAEKASERARGLTKLLLIFSKGGEPVKKVMYIGDLIKEVTKLALSGSSVKPIFSIPPDLLPVEGDEEQLGQALMNLVVNAREAMTGGGLLEVVAMNVDRAAASNPAVSNLFILISVKDHGAGIPPENLVKIFDPYFTDKAKGRGLGLSIVNSIVKKHGGTVSVQSVVGAGSTFTFTIPASEKIPSVVVEAPAEPMKGSGKVLWMDDEDMIRDLAEIMLTSLGYEASVAKDGEEAISIFKAAITEGHPFDMVILDLTIPGGMGGKETIKHLLEIDKDVRAIVCSGYSNDQTVSHSKDFGFISSLPKPFKMQDLEKILKETSMKRP